MACLGALLLALPQLAPPEGAGAAPGARAVDAAIERGVAFLRSRQDADGSWSYRGTSRPGATALAAYALLASGAGRDDEAVLRALAFVAGERVERTYDAACLLLALAARDPLEHRTWIEETARELAGWQERDGSFGYPGGGDLSNTQYAALGLRAAGLAGAAVPDEVWRRLARAVLGYGARAGSFGYRRQDQGSVSMTAAGVGTLAICAAMLARAGAPAGELAAALRTRRERGLAWLGPQLPEALEPAAGAWPFYRMYGIERVGALEELERIGGCAWYAEGAARLCAAQAADGGWAASEVQTCFALLFLKRATRASAVLTGAAEPAVEPRATSDPAAPVRIVAAGDDPTVLWISGFGAAACERFEWPSDRGRGPRVARVTYLDGERVLAEVEGDPARAADGQRFAVRAQLARGPHRVRARVVVMRPPDTTPSGREVPATPAVIESPELVLALGAEPSAPDWLLAETADRARNLLPSGRPRARASSQHAPRDGSRPALHPPQDAVDGSLRTSWLADPAEREPWLAIELAEPQRADVVLVSNARPIPHRAGFFGRAGEVLVRVNGGEPRALALPPDERSKARLVLDEPVVVRALELRLRWTVAGSGHAGAGLAEVELQLR